MTYTVTVTNPEGVTTVHRSRNAESAQRFADDLLFGMDTSEARETSIEIAALTRNDRLDAETARVEAEIDAAAALDPHRPMREILDRAQTALEYLPEIERAIRAIQRNARKQPESWAYHGDLGYVIEQLDNVATFLVSK